MNGASSLTPYGRFAPSFSPYYHSVVVVAVGGVVGQSPTSSQHTFLMIVFLECNTKSLFTLAGILNKKYQHPRDAVAVDDDIEYPCSCHQFATKQK